MKRISLYQIRDRALDSERAVFSVQQLSNMIGKPRPIATVYLSRLVKKGFATKLLKGKISFVKDDFVIATQMVEPSYVSLDSALLFHGIVQQIQTKIECVTPINSIRYERLGIIYHKIPKKLFFGYRRHSRMGSYAFIAEPEKALIDGLYLNRYSKKDFLEHAEKVDFSKLSSFVKQYNGRGSKKIKRVIASLPKRSY